MKKLIFLLSLFIICHSISKATVLNVPDVYQTIQQGIDAANNGDTLIVNTGTYYEHINFKGKAITVKSSNGRDVTIIDGSQTGRVVEFTSNEDNRSILEGFKIINGNVTNGSGGGIGITSSPTIKNNWIVNNTASSGGGGIYIGTTQAGISSPVITGNIIENNSARIGGGISAGSSLWGPTIPNISHNIIKGNTASFRGGGIALINVWKSNSVYPTVFNNLIINNSNGIYIANDQSFPQSEFHIVNNTITGNAGTGIWAINTDDYAVIKNCILWENNNDLLFTVANPIVSYSDIQDGNYNGTYGNISIDPLFTNGPLEQYYLSQVNSGQSQQSPCVDSGSQTAISLELQVMTTRTDENPDLDQVDMGYHFYIGTQTGVKTKFDANIPENFELYQNYPNPFNPATTIRYTLAKASKTKIIVYDLLGKEITTLVNTKLNAGEHTVQWNTENMASGIYIYKLITNDFVQAKKMMLLK